MTDFQVSGELVAAEVERGRGSFLVTLRVPMTADAEWVTCRQYSVIGPARAPSRKAQLKANVSRGAPLDGERA